jgi:DNA-binding SARP family transcriptional activator
MALDGVLLTRLLPPQLPPDRVEREELVSAVVAGLHDRLVTVIAGAGYGKTTLVTQALSVAGTPWVWCSCDGRIAGTRALLAHVAAGIGRRFPGFGADLSLLGGPEDQIVELANEIVETVPDDFVVALDDVHLLPDEARPALGLMVDHLGPNVHFVLAGRAPLPFSLGALRLGRVLEIGEDRLAFGPDDSRRLLEGMGAELPEERLRALLERTEGWVAGLVLAAQSGGAEPGDGRGEHFEYLAEEVLLQQPEDVRRLLEDTSVLGRFTPAMAAAVGDHPDPAPVLADLVARHLFTVRLDADGDWYRYHHLLRDVLRARIERDEPERAIALHRRAAAWWLARDEPTEAVPHLLAAGDEDAAVEALSPVAGRLALGPQSDALAAWLEVLPDDLWQARAELLLANASLLLTRAEHEASFAEHERAIQRLLELGDHERAAAALFRLQVSMLMAGTRPRLRAEIGRRWRDRISPAAPLMPAARLLLASAYGYDCRFAEAREEIAAALSLPAVADTPGLIDFAEVVRGFYVDFWHDRPVEAERAVGAAVDRLRVAVDGDPLSLRPFAMMLDLYLLLELGHYESTLAGAEVFFSESRKIGVHRSGARSAMWVRSSCLVGLGRWEELAKEFVRAPETADPAAGTSYSYRYRAPAARLAGHRRQADEVREQVGRGRAEMEAYGPVFDDATFLCDYALAAVEVDPALAAACADDAVRAAGRVGSAWLRARASLVAALCETDDAARDARIADAIEITERWDLPELWTRRERLACPPLLARALEAGLGPEGAAERLLARAGGEVLQRVLSLVPADARETRARLAELAAEIPDIEIALVDHLLRDGDPAVRDAARRSWTRLKSRPRAVLTMRAFGELRVERDGTPVPASAFVRQKARALLARLIAASGPVHREALCEDLWPDLAPDRAAAALRSTLHDLRRAIEPELEAGSAASSISTDGDTIRLAVGAEDRLDVADFLRLSRPADPDEGEPERLARLRDAVDLHRGPFLAEWPYEEWALRRREELEGAFDGALEELTRVAIACGDGGEAVRHGRRLVQRQPEREGWHRLLMRAFALDGDRAMALRQFHACRAVLRREQGIEPGAETRRLYAELLREGDGYREGDAAQAL